MRSFAVRLLALGFLLVEGRARAEDACTTTSREALPSALRMKELGQALAARLDSCASDGRRADGEAFWKRHGLEATPERVRDYTRARSLFEMTRDAGPWRIRWAITDQEPSAKRLWATWQAHPPQAFSAAPSVTAECDEISALFAGLASRVGVRKVGLFWPTNNHTIAAWEPLPGVRILVPTTQIFAGCDDTFDKVPFSPRVQKVVFAFPASDAPDAMPIPRPLAIFLLDQVTHYAGASLDVLGAIRIHRALALGSSVPGSCRAPMVAAVETLRARPLSDADRRALVRYGSTELGRTSASAPEILQRLAAAVP